MKYRVRLILRKSDPNKKGHYPIYISTTVDGDRKFIATGIHIPESRWDKKAELIKDTYALAGEYNADLASRKAQIVRSIVERQMAGESITTAQVKQLHAGGRDLHNIFDFIDEFIANMGGKRGEATLENYRKFSRKLEIFAGGRHLTFEEVDVAFLQRFENSLRAEGLDSNYIWANFKMLKTFCNAARKRGLITAYPFGQYENPQYSAKGKDRLTLAELEAWYEYAVDVADPVDRQTAVYFLLGCYTGLRISDWYQFDPTKHVKVDTLLLRATKNKEWVTMPISKAAAKVIDLVKANPLTIDEPVINRTLKDIAKELKIKKHLTTHCARHTFAVSLCAEQGIGLEVCAHLMGITVAVCAKAYYKVTNERVMREARKAWEKIL